MTDHISRERLHDLLDGLLTSEEEDAVEEHLRHCDACRREVADMHDVVAGLRALPGMAEAPAGAWTEIGARIQGTAPGPDGDVKVVAFPGSSPGRRRFHLTLPQLAAAAVVVSLLSAGVMWTAMTGGAGFRGPDAGAGGMGEMSVRAASLESPDYSEAVAELEAVVAGGRDLLTPETLATLDEALLTIDGALTEVREALEADPSSQLLGRMLANHQRTRLRLLRQAASAVQAVS